MSNDDGYASEVIRTVSGLTCKLEEHTRNGDDARKQLQETVEGIVVAMRTDVHKAIISLQLNDSDHVKSHDADRVERSNRQFTVNIWMVVLTGIVIVNLGLLIYVIAFTLGSST